MILSQPAANTASRTWPVFLLTASLFVTFLAYYSYCASTLPDRFSVDSYANYRATQYLVEHHSLPLVTAEDSSLYFTQLGTTRSLRPPLTYIVSAIVYELSAPFYADTKTRLRLGSAVLGAWVVVLSFIAGWLLTNSSTYSILAALLIGLLPRFVILASSNNDDIGAIFSVALVFCAAVFLLQRHSDRLSLVLFTAACGLVLQTKYTAWLCLPWFLILLIPVFYRARKKCLKMVPLMILAGLLLGGWWPVSNMINYGVHDPTALQHAATIQEQRTNTQANRRGYWSDGIGLLDVVQNHNGFISNSLRSAIGYLHWIKLDVHLALYWLYGVIALLSLVFLIATLRGNSALLGLIVLGVFVTQLSFYVHHNLLRDVQIEGRYLLPIAVPLFAMFSYGLNHWLANFVNTARRRNLNSINGWLPATIIVLVIGLHGLNFFSIWLAAGISN